MLLQSSTHADTRRLLHEIVDYFTAGHIAPIRPMNLYPATRVLEAFRFMQQGQHMGKIVIRIREESSAGGKLDLDLSNANIQPRMHKVQFDPDASYLLAGGLGGLGRNISTWMAARGARHFIYLSRSAKPEEYEDFVWELASLGCDAKFFAGSVASLADVHGAVALAGGKLKGVIQLAMAVRDQAFSEMTMAQWETVLQPKIDGTWNLHEATMTEKLDFFLLTGSLSGQLGNPGQTSELITLKIVFEKTEHTNLLHSPQITPPPTPSSTPSRSIAAISGCRPP